MAKEGDEVCGKYGTTVQQVWEKCAQVWGKCAASMGQMCGKYGAMCGKYGANVWQVWGNCVASLRALPLPHTVTNVTIETQRKLTQMEEVMKK